MKCSPCRACSVQYRRSPERRMFLILTLLLGYWAGPCSGCYWTDVTIKNSTLCCDPSSNHTRPRRAADLTQLDRNTTDTSTNQTGEAGVYDITGEIVKGDDGEGIGGGGPSKEPEVAKHDEGAKTEGSQVLT